MPRSSKVTDIHVFPGASEEAVYSDWSERKNTLLVRAEALITAIINDDEWTVLEMALRIANQASCVIDYKTTGVFHNRFIWRET